MLLLLDEQTINTTGTQDTMDWVPNEYNNGKGMVYAFGTFDGATLSIEFSPDNGATWFAVGSSTNFTAAGWVNFELHGIVMLRGTVTSADTSTSISLGVL